VSRGRVHHHPDRVLLGHQPHDLPGSDPARRGARGSFPAYVRFCKTQADAVAMGAVTGTSGAPASARCQAKYTNPTPRCTIPALRPVQPRVHRQRRPDIRQPAEPDGLHRGRDGGHVQLDEEMQNIANWYSTTVPHADDEVRGGRAFQQFVSNPAGSPPRPTPCASGTSRSTARPARTIT